MDGNGDKSERADMRAIAFMSVFWDIEQHILYNGIFYSKIFGYLFFKTNICLIFLRDCAIIYRMD